MEIKLNDFIIADNNICGGKPVFKGTRIMIWQVLELLGAGVSINEILKDYYPQLSRESILSLLNYASQILEDEKYVVLE
ncbi:MAG: DUF433 domain-containing protein [Candidatus Pacearchaeota archaeon]